MCGGCCSLIEVVLFALMIIMSVRSIFFFHSYDIIQGYEFYDVKNLELDVTNTLQDYVFTFEHNEKAIDMLDNEYVNLRFQHQSKVLPENSTKAKTTYLNIEPKLCSNKSYLFDHFTEEFAKKHFGTLYCMEPDSGKNFTLQGKF